jgi:hypothetical protein
MTYQGVICLLFNPKKENEEMKKIFAAMLAATMMTVSPHCEATSMDPVLEDVCCDGYQDACSICNLAPQWAIFALGIVAAVGIIVHNSASDTVAHHGHT